MAALNIISMVSAAVSIVSTVVAMATGNQTWANIAKVSGLISKATGVTSAVDNSIRSAIAFQSTQLASAGGGSVDLGTIVVSRSEAEACRNAFIAQQAAEASRQSVIASVAGAPYLKNKNNRNSSTLGSLRRVSLRASLAGAASGAWREAIFLDCFVDFAPRNDTVTSER